VKLEIDLVAERRYQASVLSNIPLNQIPVGPESYLVVIDGLIRIPLEKKDAEALLTHMRYKESLEKSPGLAKANRHLKDITVTKQAAYDARNRQHPVEADIYQASEPIPDPPSDDDDADDEDEDDDDGFAGTDDTGDGVGQA
jgi:hypothetical protein